MSASRKHKIEYVPTKLELIEADAATLKDVLNYIKETNEEAERKLQELAALCDNKR